MKILLFSNSSWSIFNFRRELIIELQNSGNQTIILSPKDSYFNKLKMMNKQIFSINIENRKINFIKELKTIYEIYKIYHKIKPDIILHFTIKPLFYGGIISRLLGIKTICMITGMGKLFLKRNFINKVFLLLYKFALKNSYKVFVQNQHDYNYFIQNKIVNENQIEKIPGSGVNLNYFSLKKYPSDQKKIIFLMISRILKEKGIKEYLEAAEIIKNRHTNVYFNLVGPIEKDSKNEISFSYIEKYINNKTISFFGFEDDVRKLIEICNCAVLPSYREGMPRSLLEASSMGRPLVSSKCIGSNELVIDGYNGFLFDIMSTESLVSALEKFISLSYDEKKNMGLNARYYVKKNYDQQIVIKKYLQNISDSIL